MKKRMQHLIEEVPRKRGQVVLTIGIDLGDVWTHYCTLNQQGEVIDRGRLRTTPKTIDKWFTDVPHARVAIEHACIRSGLSEQLKQLGHEVIVANVRELRAISHSDRKSDDVDAEKLGRYARLALSFGRKGSGICARSCCISGIRRTGSVVGPLTALVALRAEPPSFRKNSNIGLFSRND